MNVRCRSVVFSIAACFLFLLFSNTRSAQDLADICRRPLRRSKRWAERTVVEAARCSTPREANRVAALCGIEPPKNRSPARSILSAVGKAKSPRAMQKRRSSVPLLNRLSHSAQRIDHVIGRLDSKTYAGEVYCRSYGILAHSARCGRGAAREEHVRSTASQSNCRHGDATVLGKVFRFAPTLGRTDCDYRSHAGTIRTEVMAAVWTWPCCRKGP
jgi:hypothetical protein